MSPHRNHQTDSATRAAQRKQRLLEIEMEQRIEDAEALKMTEEQRQALLHSFSTVKVEFSDLDGLSWKETSRYPSMTSVSTNPCHYPRLPPPPAPNSHSLSSYQTADNTFVILTNAGFGVSNPEDTIRASPHHTSHSTSPNAMLLPSHSASSSLKRALSFNLRAITLKSKRRRLPLQGIFPSCPPHAPDENSSFESDSDSDATVCPGRETYYSGRRRSSTGSRKQRRDTIRCNADAAAFPSQAQPDPPGLDRLPHALQN